MRGGALVAVALVAGACGDGIGRGGEPGFVVTDSAGVHVVTNLDAEAPTWTLSDAPLLDLGTVEDGGPEQFFRVADVVMLSGGSIAVADNGSHEVRIFGRDGAHRASLGREGEGPGEFQAIGALGRVAGDSLVAWDPRQRRFTVFDPTGSPARTYTIQYEVLNPEVLALLDDGGAILGGPWFDFGPDGPSERMVPIYTRRSVMSPTGELVDTLPRRLYGQYGRISEGGMIGPPLFGAGSWTAGDEGGYWTGRGDVEEVTRHGLDGALERIVRWPTEERRVTQELLDASLEEDLARADDSDEELIRRMHASRPVADAYPVYEELALDSEGALWVRSWEAPGHEGPSRWMVLGPDGEHLAWVETPGRMRVTELGEDYVLGVARDELDVEHVQMWGLTRAPGNP